MQKKKRVAEAGIRQKHVRARTRQEGDERGAREQAKQRGTRRARGKHSPAYHSMSRGGCQGEYTPGGCLGVGEDRVGQEVRAQRRQRRGTRAKRAQRGTRGEMSANEQK